MSDQTDQTGWPKLRSQWRHLHTEGRMLLAETVLGWAVSLCPRDHPDTPDLLRCVMTYANRKVDDAMAKLDGAMECIHGKNLMGEKCRYCSAVRQRLIAEPVKTRHYGANATTSAERSAPLIPTYITPPGSERLEGGEV